MLISLVTQKEVVVALKSLGDLKALGTDGFGAKFFKHSWSIVREDMMQTIRMFFEE